MKLKFNLILLLALFIFLNSINAQNDKQLNSRLGKKYSGENAALFSSVKIDSLIHNLIDDVNADSVEFFIQSLQDFGTRYYDAPNRKEVSLWILQQFRRFGIEDVKLDSFTVGNTWQYNVVATIPSTEPTDRVFVVGAHHDSITRTTPMNNAPGADDNASGTTGVLEVARVLMQNDYKPDANIMFVTFAAEEIGLYGSRDFAEKAKNSDMNIRLMINHDMISYLPYIVELGKVAVNPYAGSEYYTDIAMHCVATYTPLEVFEETLNSRSSDSYSFYQQGFNSVYFEEHEFTPYYHTNDDIIDNNNIPFCAEVIKASCATLIYSMVIPDPVRHIKLVDADEGTSIYAEWNNSSATDLMEYKVYVGESTGNYSRTLTTTSNNILIDQVETGAEYFIGISVVDEDGFESMIVEESIIPFNFTMDQGILIVDETTDGDGTAMKPTDEEVDNYYSDLLQDYYVSNFDVISSEEISVKDIGSYSTIVWHGDDLTNLTAGSNAVDDLKRFLNAGGNFIYSGYLPSKAFGMNNSFTATFAEGDFLYDCLKIEKTQRYIGARFIGGTSNLDDYEDIYVDTTKTKETTNYHLSNIEALYANSSAREIYFYETQYDSSSTTGEMKGMPVGVEYFGEDYKAVTLSFPLYYMRKEQAQMFIDKIIGAEFNELTDIEDAAVPAGFSLSQNYPNPFNPVTTIQYSIPVNSRQYEAGSKQESVSIKQNRESGIRNQVSVSLIVYDILGREVATLVDGNKRPGNYEVTFKAASLSSGVYFYTLRAGDYIDSRKMLLLK